MLSEDQEGMFRLNHFAILSCMAIMQVISTLNLPLTIYYFKFNIRDYFENNQSQKLYKLLQTIKETILLDSFP
jgi:hypothetical protein